MPVALGYIGAFVAIILIIGIASGIEYRNAKKQFEANIKNRYGKNALLKGTNLQEGATTIERNQQIGGHKA